MNARLDEIPPPLDPRNLSTLKQPTTLAANSEYLLISRRIFRLRAIHPFLPGGNASGLGVGSEQERRWGFAGVGFDGSRAALLEDRFQETIKKGFSSA